jgi:hypothetical protein
MSNITYVSFLISSTTDPIGPEKRLEWLQALLELDIDLVLFVDDAYHKRILNPNVRARIVPIDFNSLDTVKWIHSVPNVQPPPNRNHQKDSVEFLTLMNSKPELLELARPYAKTPYIAYIDAGIRKVFKEPGTLKTLETLNVKSIPLVLLPGCKEIRSVETFPLLWNHIDWTFCGGFFVVPVEKITEFCQIHLAGLNEFLGRGTITWEVNVWTAIADKIRDKIVWYLADHNDTMIRSLPVQNKIDPFQP